MADPATVDLTHADYTALTEPITVAQVRAFRARIRAAQRADPTINSSLATATSVVTIVVVGFFFLCFAVVFVGVIGAAIAGCSGSGGLLFLVFLAVLILAVILLARRHFGVDGSWAQWMRLDSFATANGLQFRNRSPNPAYSGMIFHLGDSRSAFNHLNSTSGRYFDIGDFQYSTGSGKSRSTHYWGFVALHLDRRLPNMVLDSKENNTLFGSDLPTTFSRDQILSLEGDFNQHFTLYCPKEYEQDALYVFTPDLMALLIDDAGSYDVEIVDDWMFIYSPHQFPALSAATYQRLFTIVQTVGAKTVSQTANYHDDRVASPGANIVAPEGQRLRHGTSIGALIFVGVFVAFWLFSTIHGFG
jgi:energy-coupling factor transporter transmembrane protein EcfT